jgi:hypothetical protein
MLVLRDSECTVEALTSTLKEAVAKAVRDRVSILDVHLSMHGGQDTDLSGDEDDKLDEFVYCCDSISSKRNFLWDDELHSIFSGLNGSDVFLRWRNDLCHSGTQYRTIAQQSLPRCIPTPASLGAAVKRTAQERGFLDAILASFRPKPVKKSNTFQFRYEIWGACRDNQTAADAFVEGKFQGAFTWAYAKAIREARSISPTPALLKRVKTLLKQGGYEQVPQLAINL